VPVESPVAAPSLSPHLEAPGAARPVARTPAARLAAGIDWLEARALFIAAVAAAVVLSLAGIPAHLSQDGWLALVAGRLIAHHGIPQHDYLTVMAHGVRWIDQQWLAQLIMYGLQQLGGLALMTVFYVLLTGFAFGLAIFAARRLGAQDRHIVAMLPLGTFFYLATAVTIRTQGFAYPLFVSTLWLLAADARRPSRRRVYLVFPMLVLWANLHGSVTLGAGMGLLYGSVLLLSAQRARGWRGMLGCRRGWAFVLGSPLCLFVTPYGASVVSYYRATLFNPSFGKLVSEWQPVTSYTLLAVPLLLLIVGTIWALGRSGRRTPAFDQILLAVLALGAIDAVRNITWFGLAVVVLLPATIGRLRPAKPAAERRRRLNVTIAGLSVALIVVGIAAVAARPAGWFERTYPASALATVERTVAQQPHTKIFADVRFADWLVWHDPSLGGHIAYDTSFELLSQAQMTTLNTLSQAVIPGHPDPFAPYSLLVLAPANKSVNRIVLARTHAHLVLRTKKVVIATKAAA